MTNTTEQELLLQHDEKRLTILPIKYEDIWLMYKTHEAAMWHSHEVKLEKDPKRKLFKFKYEVYLRL